MTERDEWRKQLLEAADELGEVDEDGPYTWPVARAIMAELDASERDRDALAEARELLGNIPDSVVHIQHLYPRWHRAIAAFLKRTDPDR